MWTSLTRTWSPIIHTDIKTVWFQIREQVADDLYLLPETGGGVIKGIGGAGGEKAGSILNAVGGLFGGTKSASTNSAPATTNASPAASLLKLFK